LAVLVPLRDHAILMSRQLGTEAILVSHDLRRNARVVRLSLRREFAFECLPRRLLLTREFGPRRSDRGLMLGSLRLDPCFVFAQFRSKGCVMGFSLARNRRSMSIQFFCEA